MQNNFPNKVYEIKEGLISFNNGEFNIHTHNGKVVLVVSIKGYVQDDIKKLPNYKHDCENCIFLGWFSNVQHRNGHIYDLYFCPNEPTLLAKYDNHDHEYVSGLSYTDHPAIAEAKRLALAFGLLKSPKKRDLLEKIDVIVDDESRDIEKEALKKRTFDSFGSIGLGIDKALYPAVDKETIIGGCAPLGLMQREVWLKTRLMEIKKAIERYVSVNKDIPYQWIVEHDSLDREIDSLEAEEKV